jgi:GNAT superfamily N-acetyltransferase
MACRAASQVSGTPSSTPSGLRLRAAVPQDIPACLVLRGKTRENAVSVQRLAELGITAESWAAQVQRGDLVGFVVEDAQALAGYCFGNTQTGEVVVLALLPSHEAMGLGKRLLSHTTRQLAQAGHARLFLGCSSDSSTRSHGFYRHLGWVPTGAVDRAGDEVLVMDLQRAAVPKDSSPAVASNHDETAPSGLGPRASAPSGDALSGINASPPP